MDIKEKIIEWQQSHVYNKCSTSEEAAREDADLDLVLHAIDTLINQVAG